MVSPVALASRSRKGRATATRLASAPPRQAKPRVFLAQATPAEAAKLRSEGYATVAALSDPPDAGAEARRLGCTHIFTAGKLAAVGD